MQCLKILPELHDGFVIFNVVDEYLARFQSYGNDIDGRSLLQAKHSGAPAFELVDLFASLDIPQLEKKAKLDSEKISLGLFLTCRLP